jgi:phthalate 4,5-dioxygenase oxygenase subunit
MVEAARTVHAGGPAIGTGPGAEPHVSLASFAGIVPKTTEWKTLGGADLR